MKDALPPTVLAWYGDDFTGSTDVLEVLSMNGLPAVLFLRPPDAELAARFSGRRAFGLAGDSRSRSPEWMERELPAVFSWMATLGAPLCHYKVCSTFDSSPEFGSIGKAIEIGRQAIDSGWTPIIAGAPALGRYTVFGHLFAAAGDTVYRIDRHPTMSRHPVTPMHEADLRLHLAKQTQANIGLISFRDLQNSRASARLESLTKDGAHAVLIDVIDELTLNQAGRLIWTEAALRRVFVAGSSGVEHALFAWWKAAGLWDAQPLEVPCAAADRIVVLSGSCSPVTAAQIAYAAANGFTLVPLDAAALTSGDARQQAETTAIGASTAALGQGKSVILYSAAGPGAERVSLPADQPGLRHELARTCGRVLAAVLDQSGVRRIVIAGGDTASHACPMLDVEALTFLCSLAPGAPLCRTWSRNPARQNLEIVLKGGQCGEPDFFLKARGPAP